MKIERQYISGRGKHEIAVVEFQGIIRSSQPGKSPDLKERMRVLLSPLARNPKVLAVVLEISSPGGEVIATDEIYNVVRGVSSVKPVVAYIRNVGASGGYYIACAADAIVAHELAIVGSIGVILQGFTIEGLLQKLGVESRTFTSGKFKDTGSMFRPMSDEERAYLQSRVDTVYDKFLSVVATRRPMDPATLLRIADGRVFLGKEACDYKLIDATGYLEDAVMRAAELVEARAKTSITEAKVVRYRIKESRPLLAKLLSSGVSSSGALERIAEMIPQSSSELLYLWRE